MTGNSEAVVLVSVATGFNGYDKMPESEGKDYKKICREKLKSALGDSYNELRKRHIAEYRKLYTRCELELDGDDFCHMPTDERLQRIREGGSDNKLVQMLFDYGKYLLISSSRDQKADFGMAGKLYYKYKYTDELLACGSCRAFRMSHAAFKYGKGIVTKRKSLWIKRLVMLP